MPLELFGAGAGADLVLSFLFLSYTSVIGQRECGWHRRESNNALFLIFVHTFKKACAAAYPSIEQNKIVWFWPNSEPQYKNIAMKRKPPYIPELDDPSYSSLMGQRDIPYGMATPKLLNFIADREGGRPMEISVQTLDVNGFFAKQESGNSKFIPPCIFYAFGGISGNNGSVSLVTPKEEPPRDVGRRMLLVFICIPVSPGKSRLIWCFPRNFGVWIDRIIPRWIFHIGQNLILDSDLYLLHLEELKILDVGPENWQKACFVPTKADALVVGFRKWLRKYSNNQIDWRSKFSTTLPPSPPKEQLMDRYWSHVVNCSSCRTAIKGLRALEVVLQVISISSIGVVAAVKQNVISAAARTAVVSMAVLCFAASRWLSHFIYKNFYFMIIIMPSDES
ncbi:hypothetical protein Sjap_024263 [Stephania japonica]|uniref:Pheophorbide a oxygenase domain-containing protein n=1 Tax=Stephania japonica TaxID=461633 RepID=A0AAP0ED26_9MAGN